MPWPFSTERLLVCQRNAHDTVNNYTREALMRSMLSAVVVAFVVGGCRSSADLDKVAGIWQQDFGNLPGNSFEMRLYSASSGVAGTGYGCGEAGPCATSNISGTVDGLVVHLTIVSTQNLPAGGYRNFTDQFDGLLVPDNSLVGKLRPADPSSEVGLVYDVTFRRATQGGLVVPD